METEIEMEVDARSERASGSSYDVLILGGGLAGLTLSLQIKRAWRYFANYTVWQGRIRDHFFHEVAPEYYRGVGEHGELRCLYAKVEHLREAMPFEQIAVRLFLDAVHEYGVRLKVEYFRVVPDGGREKLAFGEHVAGWYAPGVDGIWARAPLPAVFREALRAAASG